MKAKRVVVAILVLLIIGCVGFYIYDITVNGTPYKENLFKFIALVITFVLSIFRVCRTSETRKPLNFYEKLYSKHIEGAFARDTKSRKKLLQAIRYYDEDKLGKALSILDSLKNKRLSKRDMNAVCLISALCHTDWGLTDAAIKEYEAILVTEPNNDTVLSNLGLIYSKAGDYENAEKYLFRALEVKPNDAFACNNIAYMYYRAREFESAIEYAHKTLDIQPNFRHAASLLTILYYVFEDEDNYRKYRQLAVKCGESGEEIDEIAKEQHELFCAEEDCGEETEE